MRVAHIQKLKQTGQTVFPHKFHVTIALRDYIDKYSPLANEQISDDVVSLAGKLQVKFQNFYSFSIFFLQVEFIQNVHQVQNYFSMIFTVTQQKFKLWRI